MQTHTMGMDAQMRGISSREGTFSDLLGLMALLCIREVFISSLSPREALIVPHRPVKYLSADTVIPFRIVPF